MNKQKTLKIGITGHRDLLESEIPSYKQQIEDYITKLQNENQDKELVLITPIASGADTIFAQVGIKIGLRYQIVLPFDQDLYEMDFNDEELIEFRNLIKGASKVETIDMFDGNTRENIKEYGYNRDHQYRAVGKYLVSICDYMLALFNQDFTNTKFGGTADIVDFMGKNNKYFYTILCKRK